MLKMVKFKRPQPIKEIKTGDIFCDSENNHWLITKMEIGEMPEWTSLGDFSKMQVLPQKTDKFVGYLREE